MRWPLEKFTITQRFRENPNQFNYGPFGHTGIDLAADKGTPILAPVSGEAIAVNADNPDYAGGLYIIVRDVEGLEHYMGHCRAVYKMRGQPVKEGETIAMVGATGAATGPHVHYQIRRGPGSVGLLDPEVIYNARNAQEQESMPNDGDYINHIRALRDEPSYKPTQDEIAGLRGLAYHQLHDRLLAHHARSGAPTNRGDVINIFRALYGRDPSKEEFIWYDNQPFKKLVYERVLETATKLRESTPEAAARLAQAKELAKKIEEL